MNQEPQPVISSFGSDTTLRWSCRHTDIVLWIRWKSIFADPETGVGIRDIWEMRDGDFVTITNRVADLPSWFELHPLEVCNSLVSMMQAKLKKGYEPKEIIEGPNIWRVQAGDRMAWLGVPRPGVDGVNGHLTVIDFRESEIVLGETTRNLSFNDTVAFGAPCKEQLSSKEVAMARSALQIVQRMGVPRTLATEWRLG